MNTVTQQINQGKHKKGQAKTSPLNPQVRAAEICDKYKIKLFDGVAYRYAGNRYITIEKAELLSIIIDEITEIIRDENLRTGEGDRAVSLKVTPNLANNVLYHVENSAALLPTSKYGQVPDFWITGGERGEQCVAENGMFDFAPAIDGLNPPVRPHDPNFFNVDVVPVKVDWNATCPRWLNFLDEVLEGDASRIAIVQQLFGYCLKKGNWLHLFFFLEGLGANGKSVVLKILKELLGSHNISAVALSALAERFQALPTVGKRANICGEVDSSDRPNVALLKQFVGEDPITIDRKGQSHITITASAKLILAGNSRPKMFDSSDGLWRRLVIIPFRVQIPKEKQDPHLVDKLKMELPGIFNWALEGLRQLQQQDGFSKSALVEEANASYQEESNPVAQFLKDSGYDEGTENDYVVFADVYYNYKKWCEEFTFSPKNAQNFSQDFARHFKKSKRGQRTINGVRGVRVCTGVTSKSTVVERVSFSVSS